MSQPTQTPAERRYAAALDASERAEADVEAARAALAAAEERATVASTERRTAYACLPRRALLTLRSPGVQS